MKTITTQIISHSKKKKNERTFIQTKHQSFVLYHNSQFKNDFI